MSPRQYLFILFVLTISYLCSYTINAKEISLATNQVQQEFSGLIGDKDKYVFTLGPSESMYFTIAQPNTHLKVRLIQSGTNQEERVIFELSTLINNWLTQKIIVNDNQCHSCILQILPLLNHNDTGQYTLTTSKVLANEHSKEHSLATMMTTASATWFSAYHNDDQIKKSAQIALAAKAYKNIITMAKQSQYPQIYIRAFYDLSLLYHLENNYQQQQNYLLKLIKFELDRFPTIHIRTLFDLGNLALDKSLFEQANNYFDQAFILAQQHNDSLMQAQIIGRRGSIASSQGNYSQAINYFEQANSIYLNEGAWQNSIESLILIGWFHYRLGEHNLALSNYHQALSYAIKANSLRLKVDALTKIGSVYRRLGDLEQANRYIDSALLDSDKLKHSLIDGWAKQAKAQVLMDAGLFNLADDWFHRAIAAFEQMSATTDKVNIYYFLGINHDNQGDYKLAEKYHKMVLAFDKQKGNNYDIGTGYYRLSQNAFAQKNYPQALVYQQQALKLLANTDNVHLLGRLYSQAAFTYTYNQRYKKSRHYFEQARLTQQKSNDQLGLINTNYRLAQSQKLQGQPNQALTTITKAFNQVQLIQKKLSRADFKANFLALKQNVAGLYIELLKQHNSPAIDTLTIAESFRSQALNQQLTNLTRENTLSPKQKQQQEMLQRQLQSSAIQYHQLSAPAQRAKIIKATRHIAEQLQSLQVLNKQQLIQAPSQATNNIDIKNIQKSLAPNTAILYFDTNKAASHLWLISHKKISAYSLPAEPILAEKISAIIATIKQPNKALLKQKSARQGTLIKQLSTSLFNNIAKQIPKFDHLIIIPDGPLNYLPISLLNQPQTNRLFIEDKNISYVPSLGVLQQLQVKQHAIKANKVLLVANPLMQAVQPHSTMPNYRLGFYAYELPYTKLEAQYIQNIIGNKVSLLTRLKANKSSLVNMPLADYQILHFATHGIANSHQPALAGLVLSNVNTDNNLLLAPEITNLTLNANLVVLSGCDTATGKNIEGEGVIGLSRAFFAAGAKRVVASLWPVKDDATAKLMAEFYRNLIIKKKSAEESLRQAKLYIKNYQRKNYQKPWQNPYYWAGFVLQGPGGKIIDG